MLDVCNPQIMRALLAEYGFRFSKAKGQNFLTQRWVPQRIVEASEIDETCGVLEVGPGFGPLTQELCLRAGSVVALEVDTTLQPILKATVGEFDNLEILFCDALKADLPALVKEKFGDKKPLACANLPYYITTPIITRLLELRLPVNNMVFMVQKEVAERIAAKKSRDVGAISLYCQYFAEPEIICTVPAGSFYPPPKVDSAVLRLKMLDEPRVKVEDEELLFKVIRASFGQRRKTLANGLSGGLGLDKQTITEIIKKCGFSETVRGETLSLEDFAKISDEISIVKRGAK